MYSTTDKRLSDADIKKDILSELQYEPSVNCSDIVVTVNLGTVTLSGVVPSYWEKANALRVAKRVAGVNAIADEIQIRLISSASRTDSEIAATASEHIKWSSSVPANTITVVVQDGMISLEGTVDWWFQKIAAENAVHYIQGVKNVSNNIKLKSCLNPVVIASDIEAAFKRSAALHAEKISVSTTGSSVTLRGVVRTFAEKEEAALAAWAAIGVMSVDNQLTVAWDW